MDKTALIGKTVQEASQYANGFGYQIRVCGANTPVQLNESAHKIDVWVGTDGKIYKA